MELWPTVIVVTVAFALALCLSHALAQSTGRWRILDHPNDRSLHGAPVPRTGGLAILIGIVAGLSLCQRLYNHFPIPLLFWCMGLVPLIAISLYDDRRSVPAQWRLLVHLWAALSILASIYPFTPIEWSMWLTGVLSMVALLLIVWMINLYNFMDGMDGFAGGMAIIGFTALAWLGRTDSAFASVCLTIAAASAGFLWHNFPPARIFLGDTGSTLLGFLVAACSVWGNQRGLFPLWAAILIFSPFIMDASVTLLRRMWHGDLIFQAHRTHYYQRLVLLGWGHRRTVLAEYALMIACAGSAIGAVNVQGVGEVLLGISWLMVYGALTWGVGWCERGKGKSPP